MFTGKLLAIEKSLDKIKNARKTFNRKNSHEKLRHIFRHTCKGNRLWENIAEFTLEMHLEEALRNMVKHSGMQVEE